jgi:hypothetical protein
MFGDYKPHRNTLLNWVRNAKIVPIPVKAGGRYFCSPDARYYDERLELYERIKAGR